MKRVVVTKSQVLHILSATVFVPVASVASGWLAKHFPGLPHYSPKQIADEQYVVAAWAGGLAIHYLHGLQLWERGPGRVVDVQDKLTPQSGFIQGMPANTAGGGVGTGVHVTQHFGNQTAAEDKPVAGV